MTNRTTTFILTALMLIAFQTRSASAQASVATQQVAVQIEEFAVISVDSDISITVNAANAGSQPDRATGSSTWSITTNGRNGKVTASLDSNMPRNMKLWATMEAPDGATSRGRIRMNRRAKTLVRNVSSVNQTGLNVTFEAEAKVNVDPQEVVRTVTYTVTTN